MYFDFEDYRPDITPVGSALSPRTRLIASASVHVAVVAAIVLGGRAAIETTVRVTPAEAQQSPSDDMRFVFVEPRNDVISPTPPPLRAPFSDEHRIPRTIERPPDTQNPLPFSQGNTPEQVERQAAEVARGNGPEPTPAPDEPVSQPAEPQSANAARLPESQSAKVILPPSGSGSQPRSPTLPGGALGDALRNLDRYVKPDQYDNPRGGNSPFGSFLQFETYGIDFGRWVRQFKTQVETNWRPLIPQSAAWLHGHVVITFNVHLNGAITDVTVVQPSTVAAFTTAAYGAIVGSNPTVPLPPKYPVDKAFFTVTFFYNERPPD
jgi:outer membrane biosynthesis protein TonB